jgi:hypothetical protein
MGKLYNMHLGESVKYQHVGAILLVGLISCPESNRAWGSIEFQDPIGDTFASNGALVIHDITRIGAELLANEILFTTSFNGPIAAPSDIFSLNNVTGFIDIDIDQNQATGTISRQTTFSPNGVSGLGSEFYLDLFSEEFQPGLVDLVDTSTGFSVGQGSVSFGNDFFTIQVDLSLLGSDDGFVNYGVIVGDFIGATDEATNPGGPPATTGPVNPIPEPWSACVWMILVVLFADRRLSDRMKQ